MMKKRFLTVYGLLFATAFLYLPLQAEMKNVTDSSGARVTDGNGACLGSESGILHPDCHKRTPEPEPVVETPPAPQPPVYIPPAPAPRAPVIAVLNMNASAGSNFATDSDILTPLAKARLADFANHIKTADVTPVAINIVGHTDSTGTDAHNQRLSYRRAGSVADFLIYNGLERDLMRVAGRGESEPVASNKTKAGRAANRRVEITVTGRKMIER